MATKSRVIADALARIADHCDQHELEAPNEANRLERYRAHGRLLTAISKFLCEPTDSMVEQVTTQLRSVQASRKA